MSASEIFPSKLRQWWVVLEEFFGGSRSLALFFSIACTHLVSEKVYYNEQKQLQCQMQTWITDRRTNINPSYKRNLATDSSILNSTCQVNLNETTSNFPYQHCFKLCILILIEKFIFMNVRAKTINNEFICLNVLRFHKQYLYLFTQINCCSIFSYWDPWLPLSATRDFCPPNIQRHYSKETDLKMFPA